MQNSEHFVLLAPRGVPHHVRGLRKDSAAPGMGSSADRTARGGSNLKSSISKLRPGVWALALGLTAGMIVALGPSSGANADDTPLRILFVGNSLTGSYDMPSVFRYLAESGGRAVEVEECIWYGSTLGERFEREDVQAALQRDWDYVVLQEYSNRPLVDPDDFRASVAKFSQAIEGRAQIVLFENWPWYGEQTIDQLDAIYAEVALEFGAIVAPLGRAWATVTTDSAIELYSDYAHPTPAGTYLGACVFYATLFDESPEGLPDRPWGDDYHLDEAVGEGGVPYLQSIAREPTMVTRRAEVL